MRRFVCTVLVFLIVLSNVCVCYAVQEPITIKKINGEVYSTRATGLFGGMRRSSVPPRVQM